MDTVHDGQIPDPRPLSLHELNQQILQYYPKHPLESDSPAQKRAMAAVLLAVVAALAAAFFLPSPWAKAAVLLSLAVEVIAGAFVVVLEVRSFDREKMKQTFASEMDADFQAQIRVLEWIRTHDRRALSSKLRFVQARIESMTRRGGVLMGGAEKLGALPIAVALFLQFRDIQLNWPLSINWSAWLLGLLILVLYMGGLLGQSLKFRLHLYETLLQEALHEDADARIAGR